MADINDLDLVEERQKHDDHVRILDHLLKLKQKKEDEENTLLKCAKAREDFSTKLNTKEEELAQLELAMDKEEQEYKVMDDEWKAKREVLEGYMFKANDVKIGELDFASFDDQELEHTAQLIEQSASLIRKQLSARRLASAIDVKRSELTYMKYWSSTTDEKFQPLLEARVKESKAVFEAGMERYRQHREIEGNSEISVAEYKSHIAYLEKYLMEKRTMVETQRAKIQALKATVRSQQETINVHFPCILSEGDVPESAEDKDQPVQTQIDNAFERGRRSMFYLMVPLYSVGRFVRSRKLEFKKLDWKKDVIKDKELLEKGFQATCHGMALADASMYQDFFPFRRTDPENYTAFYGLHPNLVWKNKECRKLVDILDWRASMQDYSGGKGATEYYDFSGEFLGSLELKPEYWTVSKVNEFFMTEMGLEMYEGLEAEYDAAMAQHRIHLQKKFENIQANAPE